MIKFISKEEAKRIWSLRWAIFTAAVSAIPLAYAALPSDWLPAIPGTVKLAAAGLVTFAAIGTAVSRVIKQEN